MKIEGPCLINFSNTICEKTIELWWNKKQIITQKKSQYAKQQKKNKAARFRTGFI